MALTPYTIERFGGLNVSDDPLQVGATAATSLSNVSFDALGRVRTRVGFETFATTSTVPVAMFAAAGLEQLVASSSTKLEVFDVGGAAVASGTVTPGVGPHSMVTYGTPSATYVIAANGGDSNLRLWNGTAWSTGAAFAATHLTVWNDSNRLVAAGESGRRVYFSDPGAPSTFGANNWVDLTPGDGEIITGAAAYQNQVFIFKETKFFVFYGESPDPDGEPVFNFRAVEGRGALSGLNTVCPTPVGVFFISRDGIYRTSGGVPELVSGTLDPLFRLGLSTLTLGVGCSLAWHAGMLYAILSSSGALYVYVLDTATGTWTQWSTHTGKAAGNFAGFGHRAFAQNTYFVNGSDSKIYRMREGVTLTDDGTDIEWSYTSGKYSVGDPGRVAVTPESSLIGSGAVTLRLDSDLYSNQSGSVTLGTAPTFIEGWPALVDQEGTWLQYTLSGSGVAQVNRLTHFVSSVKPAGVR